MRHISQIFIVGAAVVALTQGLARNSQGSDIRPVSNGARGGDELSFAKAVQRWNGHFLWEPASASGDTITRFGDETRAVFGPIPDGDCTDGAAKTIPLQIDGNIVDLKPNPGRLGIRWNSSIAIARGRWSNGQAVLRDVTSLH